MSPARIAWVAAVAALAGHATTTRASPRSDPTAGRAVFTGATVPDATSIELNPAALGLGTVDMYYAAATAVLDQVSIATKTMDVSTGALANGPDVHALELGPGGIVAALWHLKDDRITIAVDLASTPSPAFPQADALRYHTLGGSQRSYSGALATSFKITDDIYFGLGLAPQTTYLNLKYARDTALAAGHGARGIDSDCGGAPCGVGNAQATETYNIAAHTRLLSSASAAIDSFVTHLGLIVRLTKTTVIGAAFHAPPGLAVQTELSGTMDVTRAPRDVVPGDSAPVLHGGATVYLSQPASIDAELRTRLVQVLELHVGMRWQDLSRQQSYDIRGYGSTFAPHGVPEWTERALGFRDPIAVWAGVEQIDRGPIQRWRFGGRLGFETASINPSQTSPLTIAPLSLTADLGAQLRVTPGIVVQLMYGIQYAPTVHVTSSAYDPRAQIACIDSGYDYSTAACESVRLGYAIPTAAGDYDRIEHAFRIALRYEH